MKNGRTKHGHQQYHCRDCGVYTTTAARAEARAAQLALVERLHHERISQRRIARITGVSRPTMIAWLRTKVCRPSSETFTPLLGRPEIESDEQWSCVGDRKTKVWIWTAVERGSGRVVRRASGARSAATGRALWDSLPADYRKRGVCYPDEYAVYRHGAPSTRHRPGPGKRGNLSWCDSLHATLRQWCANLVRKNRSFSRDLHLHASRIRLVIDHHNAARLGLW